MGSGAGAGAASTHKKPASLYTSQADEKAKFKAKIAEIARNDKSNDGTHFDKKKGDRIKAFFYSDGFGKPLPADQLHALGDVRPDAMGRKKIWLVGILVAHSENYEGKPGGDNVWYVRFPQWDSKPLEVRLGEDNRGEDKEWDDYSFDEERYLKGELGTFACPVSNVTGHTLSYLAKGAIAELIADELALETFEAKQDAAQVAQENLVRALKDEILGSSSSRRWPSTHPKMGEYNKEQDALAAFKKEQARLSESERNKYALKKRFRDTVFDERNYA